MALLTLKDIGKIYVSEGNVSVGIRGVNLSFNKGEFVAVTGKSGSGKSTLLNVISGMDSYEEGELFIEDQPTAHYMQQDWEEYREKYISFIFQDYNIIESFTVLQNVELALMHIEDKKERRKKAMELLDKVGMSSRIKQKGSKLSGGQKQRTVIARALAKDSPIILADEPTGNLDAATSMEIIELLKEVSKDKLLIVVTHNFEQVEEHATRHIRIFDGSVESDQKIRESTPEDICEKKQVDKKSSIKKNIKNGITLGKTIFTAKPRLSIFICLLLIVGTLGVFLMTTLCGNANDIFEKNYMFKHIDGRLVVTKRSGEVISQEEIDYLVEKYGAKGSLRYDMMLDQGNSVYVSFSEGEDYWDNSVVLDYSYGKKYDGKIIGRYPTKVNEVFLYLPISCQPKVGKDSLKIKEVLVDSVYYDLVGVKYFYDNNHLGECLFTEEGFHFATARHFIMNNSSMTLSAVSKQGKESQVFQLYNVYVSFDMEPDKIYVEQNTYNQLPKDAYSSTITFLSEYYKFNYNYGSSDKLYIFNKIFTDEDLIHVRPTVKQQIVNTDSVIMSDELICKIAQEVLAEKYTQASLFFEDDEAAHKAAEKIKKEDYIAVPSDTTYEPRAEEAMMSLISSLMIAFAWLIAIIFLAFFINLCLSRTLGAFKGDMAIMRSMGIPVNVIRISMYVRMLISLIPAFAMVVATAIFIYTSPKLNEYFIYLYAWQYVTIFIGMLLLTARITYKQIRRLFGQSVKKALKGGNKE